MKELWYYPMKFHETHFEEYIHATQKENLHPKLEKIFQKFPTNVHELRNLIFYGASGVGKYTQMLRSIKRYSPTELKYEKKISVTHNKEQYFFKISDIHFEIDMSLLGCNSKLLWHEIYQQILDIISAKADKCGIIVCKYFHEIHSELLDNFYSYMQKNNMTMVDVKFVLITESISFIPDNILNCCEIINIARPSKSLYEKCIQKKITSHKVDGITNIKNLHSEDIIMNHYKIIADKILDSLKNVNDLKFLKFRDLLYDILIYNLDINECVWYIFSTLVSENRIAQDKISAVLIKTHSFFQYYNNNYRPIYHMEGYFYYLLSVLHSF